MPSEIIPVEELQKYVYPLTEKLEGEVILNHDKFHFDADMITCAQDTKQTVVRYLWVCVGLHSLFL